MRAGNLALKRGQANRAKRAAPAEGHGEADGGERIGFRGSRHMVSPSGWTVSWSFKWRDVFKSGATLRYTALQDAGARTVPPGDVEPA